MRPAGRATPTQVLDHRPIERRPAHRANQTCIQPGLYAMDLTIPFNRPSLTGREIEYIQDAIRFGQASGDGPYSKRCQVLLQELLGAPAALLTTSCTHALEMVALLLDLRPGDEVIVPSFTFVTTASAFALRGARPVFADIRPDTMNIDEERLEDLVTDRTRAIVVVHYAGVGCELDAVQSVCERNGLVLVEDNAHGLSGRYRGRYLGTFGTFATQSFHETKNIGCGEGGALIINDTSFLERAEIVREKGTNRSRFFRGEVDKYTWVDLGSSYVMSDILAAFLLAQLESIESIQAKRTAIWQRYSRELADWASDHRVQLPVIPEHCDSSYHMFHMLLPDAEERSRFIDALRQRGILSVFHYVPLSTSPQGQALSEHSRCPVAEDVAERLVRLPFYNDMTEGEQSQVIEAVRSFSPGR